ncbi:hypothetical protein ALC57_10236 [Trachymyrmex cornetzi]|uniref:Uncharacterized protein n=1 Tax=Trachymyrmex cornetzi TaxID=471704 RepID=A0A195DXV1_9HYME|nr:hypothetical protein ALC57_10236 [Trachymyrmex cornetzi]
MGDVHGLLLVSDLGQEDTAWDDVGTSAAVDPATLRGVSLFLLTVLIFSIINYDNSIWMVLLTSRLRTSAPAFLLRAKNSKDAPLRANVSFVFLSCRRQTDGLVRNVYVAIRHFLRRTLVNTRITRSFPIHPRANMDCYFM